MILHLLLSRYESVTGKALPIELETFTNKLHGNVVLAKRTVKRSRGGITQFEDALRYSVKYCKYLTSEVRFADL